MSRYSGIAHSRLTILNGEVDRLDVGKTVMSVATVAAAGTNQGTAAAVPDVSIITVTAADAAKGVILPTAEAGRVIILKNVDNAVLKVYPATGGKINVLADNASLDMAARTATMLFATSATQWYSLPLLPS
jgi:metal-dependent amidase/aminoacylase/carboxypeptidase family protein